MKVTIEQVNEHRCTVVWKKQPADFIDGAMTQCQVRRWRTTHGYILGDADWNSIGTALFAIPKIADVRRDERLWHAYAAEGLSVRGKFFSEGGDIEHEDEIITFEEKWCKNCAVFCEPVEEITHAIIDGTRVEIAIEEVI